MLPGQLLPGQLLPEPTETLARYFDLPPNIIKHLVFSAERIQNTQEKSHGKNETGF